MEGNEISREEHTDNLNMETFLEGSSLIRLRNFFKAKSDQFGIGFSINGHVVTKYWPTEFVEQLKNVDPKRFNNEMEDNQILSKITLGNYISENGKDWEGIDKVITAMEETRKSLLKKEK